MTASRLPPPDFATRCVKSLALALMRYLQAFCSITAHFRQILPVDLCNPEPLHWRGTCSFCCSVTASRLPPPDFATRCVKSLALALMRYFQAFCSITAHFRQILPVDLCNPEPLHWRGTCSFCCSVTASRLPPPDFASRCVKSLALAFMRYLQAFCSITAHFRQILNVDFVQSRALALARYVQVFVAR